MKKHYQLLKEKLKGHDHRLAHTLGVVYVSKILAEKHGLDPKICELAAIYHDFFKYDKGDSLKKYLKEEEIIKYKDYPFYYHALAAARYIEITYPDLDSHVSLSIKYHIWGRPNMTDYEKVLILADKCEEGRMFEDARIIYILALYSLDEAIKFFLESQIKKLKKDGIKPHPDQIKTLEYYQREVQ